MEPKYKSLLSPIMIGGKLAKNRMGMPRAMPTMVTGVDDVYAMESYITFSAMMAKNGAAIVTCASPIWKSELNNPNPTGFRPPFDQKGVDLNIANNRILFSRAVAAIHDYGSLASMSMMDIEPTGWTFNTIPAEHLSALADDFAKKASMYQSCGFDIVTFYMSYRNSLMAQSLSPDLNTRTDGYGGKTMAERTAFTFEVFRKVKEKCPGIIIETSISGEDQPGGFTQEEICEYVKLAGDAGLLDIVQIRSIDGGKAHPLGMNSKKGQYDTLRFAEKMKATGTSVIVAPVGGYQDPEDNERILREGKADMIYMARAFICDSQYGQKILEGRNDYTPCIRCNRCHTRPGDSEAGCSVNPAMALELTKSGLYPLTPVQGEKKVAVIGGGPAGMEAAIVAAERGCKVTLFEQTDSLDGQLKHTDLVDFKWPVRDFKDYLIEKLQTSGAEIRLGCKATPEALKAEGYDAVLYAAGAVEKAPSIPGVEKALSPLAVYGHADTVGQDVVVIGASETGIETAYDLALRGKNVTVLTRGRRIAPKAQPIHYMDVVQEIFKETKNLQFIKEAATTEITDQGVSYQKDGESCFISCDTVIACGGSAAVTESMLEFASVAPYFRVIGDSKDVSNLRNAMRSAYTAAAGI